MKYSGIHRKLNRVKGKASEYICACGEEAKEWAYDNVDRGMVSDFGVLYSDDVNHYIPMCRRCHALLDKSKITHCPQNHEYTEENTLVDAGKRKCKTCVYARNRGKTLTPEQRKRATDLQRERRAAARMRVALDQRLGYATEDWITEIANGDDE